MTPLDRPDIDAARLLADAADLPFTAQDPVRDQMVACLLADGSAGALCRVAAIAAGEAALASREHRLFEAAHLERVARGLSQLARRADAGRIERTAA